MRPSRTLAGIAAITAASAVVGCANLGSSDDDADWPSGAITMIVAFDPGGGSDVGARLLATELEDELGVSIVVENVPGAGGQVGYTQLANSPADGSTFGLTTIPGLLVAALDESRGAEFDPDSFEPSALQVIDPMAIAVRPDSDIETLDDLVEAAQSGDLTATTTGIGTAEHIALLQFNEAANVDIQPVHFADGAAPATTAFLGGNVDILLSNVGDITPTVENGDARVIAVMDDEPSIFLPDVETTVDAGIDVQVGSSRGFVFPAGTPQEIVDEMSVAIETVLADEAFQEQMANAGLQASYMDADEYGAYWDEQAATLDDIIQQIHEEE